MRYINLRFTYLLTTINFWNSTRRHMKLIANHMQFQTKLTSTAANSCTYRVSNRLVLITSNLTHRLISPKHSLTSPLHSAHLQILFISCFTQSYGDAWRTTIQPVANPAHECRSIVAIAILPTTLLPLKLLWQLVMTHNMQFN